MFDTSNKLNENITLIICTLFEVKRVQGKKELEKELWSDYNEYRFKIAILEWDIRNYTQFAVVHGITVVQKQEFLIKQLQTLFENKGGDVEPIRKTQFEFNDAVKKAHAEILNLKNNK